MCACVYNPALFEIYICVCVCVCAFKHSFKCFGAYVDVWKYIMQLCTLSNIEICVCVLVCIHIYISVCIHNCVGNCFEMRDQMKRFTS